MKLSTLSSSLHHSLIAAQSQPAQHVQLQAQRKVEALEAALARIDAAEGAALDELMASR